MAKLSKLDKPTIITLTLREKQVLQHLAQGKFDKEIADALNISLKTVSFHCGSIHRKLNVMSRTEAVSWALRNGLMTDT